jgi:hypothetical protein
MTDHVYRGIRHDACLVLVDDAPLPMSARGREHSPSGFEWGYGGSGPAALAHSILSYEVGEDVAHEHYQAFKWKVISQFNRDQGGEEWQLTSAEIRRWLEEHTP